MNARAVGAALIVLALLGACAPTSRITLLPEDTGKPSAVEIKTKAGSAVLSRPYQTASVGRNGDIGTGETNAASVAEQHKLLLSQQPAPALLFALRFSDGSSLTPESEKVLAQILARAAERPGAEIFVTGYTDTMGTVEVNDAVSLQRAKAIRERLIRSGFKPELVVAIGRGERELLIPTADEVVEPENRRVEVVIR